MRSQDSVDNGYSANDRMNSTARPSMSHFNYRKYRPWLRSVSRCLCRLWFCVTGNMRYKRLIRKRATKIGVNSRSELDAFARIVFPFSFILFNILYWVYFLHLQR